MNDRPHELALQAAYFALLAVGRGSLARAAFQKQRAAEEQTKHLRRWLSRRVVPTTFALEQYAKTLNEHLAKVETIPATLTVRQVAEALGVSRARVAQLLRAGVIPGVKIGPHANSAWRIQTREFLAMFTAERFAEKRKRDEERE